MAHRKKSRFQKSAFKGRLRIASKSFLVRPANNRCQICGYDKYIGNLSFHHKNPDTKSFNISMMILKYSLPRLVAEASKCILTCHNCHGEIHAGIVCQATIDAIPTLDYSKYKMPADVVKWYCRRKKQ